MDIDEVVFGLSAILGGLAIYLIFPIALIGSPNSMTLFLGFIYLLCVVLCVSIFKNRPDWHTIIVQSSEGSTK